jgi:acetyl-CoA carboxylase biotin carboxyl carrier protein
MDIEKVRNLIQLMIDNDLVELEVQEGESRVALRRRGELAAGGLPSAPLSILPPSVGVPQPVGAETQRPPEAADEIAVTINSPMVGTFYNAHDPESPPYVQVGSEVEPETVVCIIEAMKVYNEIRAEVSGVVEEVLVRNEDPVEFGQPLFKVRPRS